MHLTVIICTHNPREDYLRRTLGALEQQTLPKVQWELLLIDNASKKALAGRWDLSWHPGARHIREDEVGLTPARLRGIRESTGDILVFVDDDNVLIPEYLATGLDHLGAFAQLGTLGPGIINADYESPPSKDLLQYTAMLALRNEHRPQWSNQVSMNPGIPYGAGLFVRKIVAEKYAEAVKSDSVRKLLDRSGIALLSGGDIDICITGCSMGFGAAVFPDLRVEHLIPASRVELDYLVRIAEGHEFSHYILGRVWNYAPNWKENVIVSTWRHLVRLFRLKNVERRIYLAKRRGEAKGRKFWRQLPNSK